MRILIPKINDWLAQGQTVAVARVLETWGSAPRRPGSWMIVSKSGEIAGSVSGGCVEGAVREVALDILQGGPARLVEFGIDNDDAWSVGLSCGGRLLVAVQPFPEIVGPELIESIESGQPVTWISSIKDGKTTDTLTDAGSDAVSRITFDHSATTTITQHFARPDRILIIGGAEIAIHLTEIAKLAGFETILVDPRSVFTGVERFPTVPDQIHTSWPQEVLPDLDLDANTYTVLLTHDPKIDDPAIEILLASSVEYIGALGGRKTQEQRQERLRKRGHSDADISRIKGPVGLKIGAATPPEIAVSILGEIIQFRNARKA